MIKKLLLLFMVLTAFISNAQTISIVGEAVGGWPDNDPLTPDTHIMSTTDNVHYTYSNLVVTNAAPGGGAKFRQDGAWATNWGSPAFPSGTGTNNGSNIVTVAGTYNVTFNRLTGAYNFSNVVVFPSIGIIGTVNGEGGFGLPDVDMITFDGITYKLTNHTFLAGEAKFRMNDSWDNNWGSTAFPTGTATMGGPNIPVPAGTFTVTFNIQTGAYSFEYPSVGILGTAVDANGFNGPDVNLTTTDGINYKLINHTFTDGEAKFRLNDSWDTNWGNAAFPTGIGTQGGDNVMVTAGTYTVTFNRSTGEYLFGPETIFPNIGITGTAVLPTGFDGEDVNMITNDGITYTLENYVFTNGEAKFRMDDAWITSWGGPNFPGGTAVLTGVNIPVTAGTYTVTFNYNSLSYTFVGTPTFPTVGILGTAVNANGFSGPDVNLITTDGINYTLSNHTFAAGEAKFRQDDAWDINWGSANFPSGTATLNGQNIAVLAGTFNVNFNRITGDFSFSTVGEFPSIGILGTAVNADGFNGPDTNLATNDGIIYTLSDFTFAAGEAKFRQDDAWDLSWGAANFPTGTATVGGPNIVVTPGTYNVTFNRLTLAYSFSGNAFPSIGIIGTAAIESGFDGADVDMTTSDGINYNLNGHNFTTGEAKFRQDNAWDVNWGSADFPTGFGTQGGDNIQVVGNRYNVHFNRLSGNYSFNYVSIGIIGTAVNGFDVADTDMGTNDGITYTITLQLVPGEFKLRENDSWAVNWGGAFFPSDIYIQDGANVVVTAAGEYTITFNRVTGDFNAVLLGVKEITEQSLKVYPNPSNNVWNFTANNEIKSIQISDVLGKVILIKNSSGKEAVINAQALPNGLYFAKVTSDTGSKTIKVIKK